MHISINCCVQLGSFLVKSTSPLPFPSPSFFSLLSKPHFCFYMRSQDGSVTNITCDATCITLSGSPCAYWYDSDQLHDTHNEELACHRNIIMVFSRIVSLLPRSANRRETSKAHLHFSQRCHKLFQLEIESSVNQNATFRKQSIKTEEKQLQVTKTFCR